MVSNNKTGSLFLEFNWWFLKTQQIALHSLLKYGLIVAQVASSAIATLDCKTVGFFLKISKEIGKARGKNLKRAKRASLTRP